MKSKKNSGADNAMKKIKSKAKAFMTRSKNSLFDTLQSTRDVWQSKQGSLVAVKPSTIHGNGLFARCDIQKNTIVTFYDGLMIDWKTAKNLKDQSYVRSISTFYTAVDGIRVPDEKRGLGSFANHSSHPNAKFFVKNNICYIKLLTDVNAGDEIFTNYGNNYWKVNVKNNEINGKK